MIPAQSKILRKPVKQCKHCGEVLEYRTKGEVCAPCISKRARKHFTHCDVCHAELTHKNQSGLCRTHGNEKRAAERLAREALNRKPVAPFQLRDVIDAASLITGYIPSTIMGERRFKPLVRIRAAIYRVAVPYYSRAYMGSAMGGRDHTTVMHGLDIAHRLNKESEKFSAFLVELESEAIRIAGERRRAIMAHVEALAS